MALKVSNTTVIDDSRNLVNIGSLSISGISTIGTLQVSSGIVTATSGVVTYYGDGSKLSGVTAAASITITQDTTNKGQFILFSPTTGTVAQFNASTSSLVFNPSTNRLGIGTTNPLQKLHVVDSILVTNSEGALSNAIQSKAYANQYSIEDVDGYGTRQYISIDKSDTSLFRVNDDSFNTKVIVSAGGSVGIGSTSPRFALDVNGSTNISGNLTVNNVNIAGGLTWQTVGAGNTIYTLGRVGIGTTVPLQALHVVDAIVVSSASTTLNNAIQSKAYANQYSIEDVDGYGTRQYISIDKSDTSLFRVNDDSFNTKVIVSAGGSVGIGSTSPRFALDVVGSSNISGSLFVNNVNIAGGLTWQTGIGNSIYTLGRVGIGTTIPLQSLHVVDAIVVSSASTSLNNAIQEKVYANQYSIEDVDGYGNRQYISIAKSDTDLFKVNDDSFNSRLLINSSGFVGLGTTNPKGQLQVSSGPVIVGSITSTGTASQNLQVTGGGYISGSVGIGTAIPIGKFQVSVGSTTTPAIVVTDSGNVGLGTTNPLQRLHVVDAIVVSSASTTLSNAIQSKAYANQYSIEDVDGYGTRQYISIDKSDTSLFRVNDDSFNTKVIVSAGGSVGIGSTSPRYTLDVQGDINFSGTFYQGGQQFVSSKWTTGAGTTIYRESSVGIGTTSPLQKLHVLGNLLVSAGSATTQHITQKAYELNNGTLSWEGTAGQLFSITNNLTSGSIFSVNDVSGIPSIDVDANGTVSMVSYGGSVGIGTTNPTSKLQVVGSFTATTKSFFIDHPTKEGKKLEYGSLESPYHGIRLTGSSIIKNGICVIDLPDYIYNFVKEEGINIQITNIKHGKVIWVEDVDISNNNFVVMCEETSGEYKFYWDFTAIRTDVDDLIVEV